MPIIRKEDRKGWIDVSILDEYDIKFIFDGSIFQEMEIEFDPNNDVLKKNKFPVKVQISALGRGGHAGRVKLQQGTDQSILIARTISPTDNYDTSFKYYKDGYSTKGKGPKFITNASRSQVKSLEKLLAGYMVYCQEEIDACVQHNGSSDPIYGERLEIKGKEFMRKVKESGGDVKTVADQELYYRQHPDERPKED